MSSVTSTMNKNIFSPSNKRINIVKFGFAILIFIEYLLIFQRIEIVYELRWKTILFPWVMAVPFLYIIPKYKAFFSFINWLFIALIIGGFHDWEYHVDYTYISFALGIFFVDLNTKDSYSRFDELFLFFICVAYFYFDSVLFKINSTMWANGMGLWAPVSNIVNVYNPKLWEFFGSYRFLSQILSHLTFFFEAILLFVFWINNRALRIVLISIGVGLHFGILLAFPIPLFAAFYILLYVLIFPYCDNELNESSMGLRASRPKILTYSFFIFFLIFSISTHKAHFSWHNDVKILKKLKQKISRYMGIINHGVFVDWHFAKYNHVFNIRSKNHEIPLVHKDGRVGLGNFGRYWANYSFRVNKPGLTKKSFKESTIPKMKLYIKSHGLINEEYKLYYKKIQPVYEYQDNFLSNQRKSPWIEIGTFNKNDLEIKYKEGFLIDSMF